jgi:thiamine-phosphate pyrophosphorylase
VSWTSEHAGHDRPWFAIGGISMARLDEVIAAGADRVVVVRAITAAEDPTAAAAAIATHLNRRPPGPLSHLPL